MSLLNTNVNASLGPSLNMKIGRYECEVGYNGMPGKRFEFTPISNAEYKNERCMPKNKPFACDVDNNGIF